MRLVRCEGGGGGPVAAKRRRPSHRMQAPMSDDQLTEIDAYYRFFELKLDSWALFDSVNLRNSKIVLASDLNPVIDFFNAAEVGIGGRNPQQAAPPLNLDAPHQRRPAGMLRRRRHDVYTLRPA